MSVAAIAPALRARSALLEELEAAGIEATGDSGAFYPQPIGVLVGLPTLAGKLLDGRTFTVPVTVVSGEALNNERIVSDLYTLADDVAGALSIVAYRPISWRASLNAEPLPALELVATVTVSEEG